MKVVNLSTIAQQVSVILPDGRTTSIRIMPKARVGLADGQKICSNWLALNPGVLKLFDEKSPAATPAPVSAPTDAPKLAAPAANPAPVAVRVKTADASQQGE
ncbi:MAG: hypothetical protein ACN6OP_11265 [Pseudomonadales bacterium]